MNGLVAFHISFLVTCHSSLITFLRPVILRVKAGNIQESLAVVPVRKAAATGQFNGIEADRGAWVWVGFARWPGGADSPLVV